MVMVGGGIGVPRRGEAVVPRGREPRRVRGPVLCAVELRRGRPAAEGARGPGPGRAPWELPAAGAFRMLGCGAVRGPVLMHFGEAVTFEQRKKEKGMQIKLHILIHQTNKQKY